MHEIQHACRFSTLWAACVAFAVEKQVMFTIVSLFAHMGQRTGSQLHRR
jgi:hypothetical protein